MADDFDSLNTAQQQGLLALLVSRNIAAAAKKAGVSDRVIRQWLGLPAFLAAYREARRRQLEVAVGRMQQIAGKAVRTLERAMSCGNPATEVKAAAIILDQSAAAVKLVDLAERVEALEQAHKATGRRKAI